MAQSDIMRAGPREGFRPSYRPAPKRRRLGPGLARMGMVAASFGGVLLLVLAGRALIGQHRTGVPVIEAEAGPVRIKPVNAGGMQVTGADFNPGGDANQALAPAAEQPQIDALRAQLHAVKRELARQAAETAQVHKETAQVQKLAEAKAEARIAAPAPLQHASAVLHVPAPALGQVPAPVKGVPAGTAVQLAALTDEAGARREWGILLKKAPDLLGGRTPEVTRAQVAGRTMWRLRMAGFGSVAEASGFCAKMHEHGADCTIAAF
jgi:hypothetical protein